MKKIFLSLFLTITFCIYGQENEHKLEKQLGIDFTLVSASVFYEHPLTNTILGEASVGISNAFTKEPTAIGISFSTYRPFSRVSLKWYFNRKERLEKGKDISLNTGSFIGIQNKTTYGYGKDEIFNTAAYLINEVYWGQHTRLSNNLLFHYHLGVGYFVTKNNSYNDGFFPTVGVKFKYIF